MKIQITEHEGCFGLDITPESMAEAALLTRLALNATKEVRSLDTTAAGSGDFNTWIVFGKRRRPTSSVRGK